MGVYCVVVLCCFVLCFQRLLGHCCGYEYVFAVFCVVALCLGVCSHVVADNDVGNAVAFVLPTKCGT